MRTLILILFLAGCGSASEGGGEDSSTPTEAAKSLLPKSGTSVSTSSTATSTANGSNKSAVADKPLPIVWSLTVGLDGLVKTTNKTTVPLSLNALLVKAIEVNDLGCWSNDWVTYPYRTTIDIPFTARNGVVTLYVRLIGDEEQISDCKTAIFYHDDKAPTANSIKINDQAAITNKTSVSLTLSSIDASEMYVTNAWNCAYGGFWKSFQRNMTWELGATNTITKVYAKFRDAVGNESACIDASILHDNIPPSLPRVSIANGDAEATSALVNLSLYASEATEMAIFSSYSTCSTSTSGWIPYATTKTWTLPSSSSAMTAYVYVKYRDTAGNESSCVSDSISMPSVKLVYTWFEGSYYPSYSACGFLYTRDYTSVKTKTVTYAPFTTLSSTGRTCDFSRSGSTYYCDWTDNLANCGRVTEYFCNGKSTYLYTYPGALSCVRPSGVPL